jgi:photosystem II stability/assembly factor-like uncharacterized protein
MPNMPIERGSRCYLRRVEWLLLTLIAALSAACVTSETAAGPGDMETVWEDLSGCERQGDSRQSPTRVHVVGMDESVALALVTLSGTIQGAGPTYETQTAVLRTDDEGRSWSHMACLDGAASLWSVAKQDHVRVVTQWRVAGNYPSLWTSDDSGTTWQERPIMKDVRDALEEPAFVEAQALAFDDSSNGTMILEDQSGLAVVATTSDAGRTWEVRPRDAQASIAEPTTDDRWHVREAGDRFEVRRRAASGEATTLVVPRVEQ